MFKIPPLLPCACALFILFWAGLGPCKVAAAQPKLAVVIDDVGYNLERGRRAIDIPSAVTVAILPFAPNTRVLAEHARRAGKEVILHQPMQSLGSLEQERDTLTLTMDRDRFTQTLNRAIANLPQSSGVSNHTGSLLTQHQQSMNWLMAHLSDRGLYFLDSRTTKNTVAEATALNFAVPVIRRDVFLDNERTPHALVRAFDRALHFSRTRGHAVMIAHPHRVSLEFLERALPGLLDVEVVPVSALVRDGQKTPVSRGPDTLALH